MLKLSTILPLAGAGLATAAASAAPLASEARLERLLEGRVAGKPVQCINQQEIRSTQIIDRTAIVYRVGNKLFVNRPNGANQLRRDDILVSNTLGTQLCRIDPVRTVDRTALFQTGFVNLGEFVPYIRPKQ